MQRFLKIAGVILSLSCLVAISVLSLVPNVSMVGFIPGEDKTAHFVAYAAFSFFLFLSFCSFESKKFVRKNLLPLVYSFVLAFSCGYAIELVQPSFGRCFESLDLLADGLGALLGVLLGLALTAIFRKKLQ